MKTIRVFMVLTAVFLCFAGTAEAQRTRRTAPRKRPPAVKPTPKPTAQPMEVRLAREKVSNQHSNVNRFIDLLGPIAANIETLDREARTRRISKKSIDDNEATKKKVVTAISDLRKGLVSLESEFRTKPSLRKFLPQLQGIAELSAQSETAALSGRFVDSRKPLVAVVGKLSDTLAVMP